jgi:hypothetical protein
MCLWFESCCGEGALLMCLLELCIGVEIDVVIVCDFVWCGDCMVLCLVDLGDVQCDVVCVVMNLLFNGVVLCEGINRIVVYSSWLLVFLMYMVMLVVIGVFILSCGVIVKWWWCDIVVVQFDIVVVLELLGCVHFVGIVYVGVDVVLVVL